MREHRHCFGAIDVKINKKNNNSNEAWLNISETYCCLECALKMEYGATYYSSSSEIDKIEEDVLEYYDYLCMGDEDLLVAIYNRIKVKHPDISSDDMLKYICAALYNMENKTVTLERYKKRVLRLKLNSEFNNWDKNSVMHYVD